MNTLMHLKYLFLLLIKLSRLVPTILKPDPSILGRKSPIQELDLYGIKSGIQIVTLLRNE